MQEWVFYLTGVFSLSWVLAWLAFYSDDPDLDRYISSAEQSLILRQKFRP